MALQIRAARFRVRLHIQMTFGRSFLGIGQFEQNIGTGILVANERALIQTGINNIFHFTQAGTASHELPINYHFPHFCIRFISEITSSQMQFWPALFLLMPPRFGIVAQFQMLPDTLNLYDVM